MSSYSVALPQLLAPDVAARVAAALADAPFSDGRATAHGGARDAKRNQQLEPAHPLAREHGATLVAALNRSERFMSLALPHTILPFTFARYEVGMAYGDHLDLPVVGTPSGPLRTDLSLTVFLSSPDAYDGGELVIPGDDGPRWIKGGPGDAFLYPSDTLHHVAPITRGQRLVAITWIQSLVPDAEQRAILAGIGDSVIAMHTAGAPDAAVTRLRQVQHKLLRRWARA